MRVEPRHVVTGLGVLRIGIGAAFLVSPRRLADGEDVLMIRSFAVRELVLGVGGVMGAARSTADWARLGALVDVGDAASAAIAVRHRVPRAVPALLAAIGGLTVEAWALRRVEPR